MQKSNGYKTPSLAFVLVCVSGNLVPVRPRTFFLWGAVGVRADGLAAKQSPTT
jgi:hypothetical protein